MTVYHPISWAHNWPRGAKPYATRELCEALEKTNDIMESSFCGESRDVITEAPVLTQQEEQFVAENPGGVVETVAPEPRAPVPKSSPKPSTLSKFKRAFK